MSIYQVHVARNLSLALTYDGTNYRGVFVIEPVFVAGEAFAKHAVIRVAQSELEFGNEKVYNARLSSITIMTMSFVFARLKLNKGDADIFFVLYCLHCKS